MSKIEDEVTTRFDMHVRALPLIPRIEHVYKVVPPPPRTKVEKIQDFFEEIFSKVIIFLGGCVLIIASIYVIILFALGIMKLMNV